MRWLAGVRGAAALRLQGRAAAPGLAQAAGVVAATRPALWQGAPRAGRRHYRLMRDHLTPVPQSLLTQLVQMPEVRTPLFPDTTPVCVCSAGAAGQRCLSGHGRQHSLRLTDGARRRNAAGLCGRSPARCTWQKVPSRMASSVSQSSTWPGLARSAAAAPALALLPALRQRGARLDCGRCGSRAPAAGLMRTGDAHPAGRTRSARQAAWLSFRCSRPRRSPMCMR